MRIISQDGTLDLPYEGIGITIGHRGDGKEFYIFAHLVNSAEPKKDPQKLGAYSTEAKSQKAMEMLRTAYTGTPLIFENCDVTDEVFEELKRRSIEAILTVTNDKPKVDYLDNFYFRFPKDEDVEG